MGAEMGPWKTHARSAVSPVRSPVLLEATTSCSAAEIIIMIDMYLKDTINLLICNLYMLCLAGTILGGI